jgi:hypothetical protein
MKTTMKINNFQKKKIKHRVKLPKCRRSHELLHKDPKLMGGAPMKHPAPCKE